MASQASATTLKKRGLGRGPNNIPRAPTNLNERTLIQIRPGPNNKYDNYRRLFNERYPEGTERPDFDQELWERASVVRKNYIKGQGQKRRPSFSGSFNGSGSTQSSQSSTHPPTHTPADCVRAICADPELLRILGGHLGALDPDVLARAVAEATASQRADDSQGSNHDDREGESGRS
ncbi:hypothetical protein POM88_031362 [Heracleum sosnowskyi]|uniref:Uncharacterized protein n=1 Tax=Heracleum sosnowskyi TaxID=360622 RepID=A0AAD8MJP3_9APIA|nr:hypothetical protein POM88_031362 [Heracleum sosnowskyi]